VSELAKALLAFQKEAPELSKSSEGQVGTRKYKYLGLDEAMGKIRPLLNKHGVVISQTLGANNGSRLLQTTLTHAETGDRADSSVLLPDTDDMQALGSAITYARRYSLISMLGLVADEDEDGNKATPKTQPHPEAKPSSGPLTPTMPITEMQPAASEKPVAASERKASAGTVQRLKETVEALQKGFPSPDPNHSWWNDVQSYMEAELGKKETGALTEAEMVQVVQEFEGRLAEQHAISQVPFG
jgi:hypothetical protein